MKNLNKLISTILIVGLIFGLFIVTGCQHDTDDPVVLETTVTNPTDSNVVETPVDPENKDTEETTKDENEVNNPTENEENNPIVTPDASENKNTEDITKDENEVNNPTVTPVDPENKDNEETTEDKNEESNPIVTPDDNTDNTDESTPVDPEDPEEDITIHEPVIVSIWKSSFNDEDDNIYSTAEIYTSDGELRAKVTINDGNETNWDFKVDTDNIIYKEFIYDVSMEYELNGKQWILMSALEDKMDDANYEERNAIIYPKTYEFKFTSADDPTIALYVDSDMINTKQYAPLIDNPLPMDDCIDVASYDRFSFYTFVVNGRTKNYKKMTYGVMQSNVDKLMSNLGRSEGGITEYIFNNYTVTLKEGDPTLMGVNELFRWVFNYDIDIMTQFWDR